MAAFVSAFGVSLIRFDDTDFGIALLTSRNAKGPHPIDTNLHACTVQGFFSARLTNRVFRNYFHILST